MPRNDLKKVGISGLDRLFYGGIPEGNLILVEGGPGAGKTLMGVEFIYRGITEFDEPGIIVLFETSAEKLMRQASSVSAGTCEELQEDNKLKIISTSPEIFDQELRSPDSLLTGDRGRDGCEDASSSTASAFFARTTARTGTPRGNRWPGRTARVTANGTISYRDLLATVD